MSAIVNSYFSKAKWIWLPKSHFPNFQTAQKTTFDAETPFCVAVGGTVCYHLIAKTLGVTFAHGKPVFVKPKLGPLSYAEGVIPLAGGKKANITVKKENGNAKRTITEL